jgi:hypothetical protein
LKNKFFLQRLSQIVRCTKLNDPFPFNSNSSIHYQFLCFFDSLSSRCFFDSSIRFRPFILPSAFPFRQCFFHSVCFIQSPFKSFSSFASFRSFLFDSVLVYLFNLLFPVIHFYLLYFSFPICYLWCYYAFEFRDIAVSPTSTQSGTNSLLVLHLCCYSYLLYCWNVCVLL